MTPGRVVPGVILAFLLPMPLVLLLSGKLWADSAQGTPEQAGVVPVLGHEARKQLATYHRDCDRGSDCEAPLACVDDPRVWVSYCTDSQCMTDVQCPEGQVCRSVASTGGKPLVRYCVPVGVRREGERCKALPGSQEEACAAGLLCGGHEGWCGRPCRRGEEGSCPEGFFCADTTPEPLCLPTCETRGCAEGQQCVRFEGGVSVCGVVVGNFCQQSGCPAGSECDVLDSLTNPGHIWMDCVRECGDEGQPACPDGNVCYMFRCQPSCDPNKQGACGEGLVCEQYKPGRPWVCSPDW